MKIGEEDIKNKLQIQGMGKAGRERNMNKDRREGRSVSIPEANILLTWEGLKMTGYKLSSLQWSAPWKLFSICHLQADMGAHFDYTDIVVNIMIAPFLWISFVMIPQIITLYINDK